MPPFDAWLKISIELPFFLIVVLLVVLISAVSYGIVRILRFKKNHIEIKNSLKETQQKNDHLELQVKELAEANKQFPGDEQLSGREAYQNFIYYISHEISNPLQNIQTNLDNMAGLSPEEKGRWEQYRLLITGEIRRLRDMTSRLRLLSRLEVKETAIEREVVNIQKIIESVILEQDELARANGVELKMNCHPHTALVMINRDQIKQVLLNLVDNAIKYGPDKGGRIIISVQDDNDHLCVRVIDNGIGIPEEDIPHIFDVAYRAPGAILARKKGSGLGLTIVKKIVEQHGGKIDVSSVLGQGTTVTFYLPIAGN